MNQYQAAAVHTLSQVDGSVSVSIVAMCMDPVYGFVMEPRWPTGARLGPHVQSHSVQAANRISPHGEASSAPSSSHPCQLLNIGQQQVHPLLSECSPQLRLVSIFTRVCCPKAIYQARVSS